MTWTRNGDKVTLEMAIADWEQLLMMMGIASGKVYGDGNMKLFYRSMDFVNRMNATNPDFKQYEIPEEFR